MRSYLAVERKGLVGMADMDTVESHLLSIVMDAPRGNVPQTVGKEERGGLDLHVHPHSTAALEETCGGLDGSVVTAFVLGLPAHAGKELPIAGGEVGGKAVVASGKGFRGLHEAIVGAVRSVGINAGAVNLLSVNVEFVGVERQRTPLAFVA